MVGCFNDKIIAREKRKNYLGLKSILRKGAAVTITEERSMQRGASLISQYRIVKPLGVGCELVA